MIRQFSPLAGVTVIDVSKVLAGPVCIDMSEAEISALLAEGVIREAKQAS